MNKYEFLSYLEKRLSVLNKKEREDIIAEYSQHIDMKVKSGLTEYEAIKDFGNIKEFVDEILEAYNIDPGFDEEIRHSEESVINKAGHSIKGAADFLFDCLGTAKKGISRGADFVLTQRPSALIFMLFKILVVAAVLFMVGFAGLLIPTIINAVVSNIIDISDIIYMLYTFIAVIVGAYVLFCYIKRLAYKMALKSGSVSEKTESENKATGVEPVAEKVSRVSGKEAKALSRAGFEFTGGFLRNLWYFCKRAVLLMFKLCVIGGLGLIICMFLPAVVFTAFALVFAITGYPAIGVFMISLGFCLCCAAFMLIVIKLVFSKKGE